MNVKRITRLLNVLQILQTGTAHNCNGLAGACKVSRRTAFRDIEALRTAGIPIAYDAQHDRYSIPTAHFLPPVNFTAEEAVSLLTLALEMGQGDRLPFFEPARLAAMKLLQSLPPHMRDIIAQTLRNISISPTPIIPLRDKRVTYHRLLDAMADHRVVRIEYRGATEQESISTKFRPYQLLFRRHCWYVVGRSSIHRGVWPFSLSRITAIERLDEKYSVPRNFNSQRYLKHAWHVAFQPGPELDVVVRFQPLVAQNVTEVIWHQSQQVEHFDDGSVIYRARVSGLNEITWWILSFGDQAEVMEPERLRRFIAQRSKNMAALYSRTS